MLSQLQLKMEIDESGLSFYTMDRIREGDV
jgi:hypothetical protein